MIQNDKYIRPIYKFDDKWTKWIKENIDRKSNKNEIFKLLLNNHFDYELIKNTLGIEYNERKSFDEKWKNWIKKKRSDNIPTDKIKDELLKHHFDIDLINSELNINKEIPIIIPSIHHDNSIKDYNKPDTDLLDINYLSNAPKN